MFVEQPPASPGSANNHLSFKCHFSLGFTFLFYTGPAQDCLSTKCHVIYSEKLLSAREYKGIFYLRGVPGKKDTLQNLEIAQTFITCSLGFQEGGQHL